MNQSIIKQLEYVFKCSWHAPALTDYESDQTYTYGDVATRIRSLVGSAKGIW